jgi:hypothetical protein
MLLVVITVHGLSPRAHQFKSNRIRPPSGAPAAAVPSDPNQLARLNQGRRQGAFHLDLKDGAVTVLRLKPCCGEAIPNEVLEGLLGFTFTVMEEHASKIFKLIYSSRTEQICPSEKTDRFAGGTSLELN